MRKVKRRTLCERFTRTLRAMAACGLALTPISAAPINAIAAGVASVLLMPDHATATIYYVNGTSGSDSGGNTGTTPSTPRLTLPATLSSGDVVYVTGNAIGVRTYTGVTNPTVTQWLGQPQGWIRGDTPITASWTLDSGTTYRTPVTQVNGIIAVTLDWDSNVNSDGFHFGHIRHADDLADCKANGGWWWESDVLYFNNGGGLPESGSVHYCDTSGRNLLQFSACINPTASGLYFALNPHTVDGQGYGVYMQSSSNPTIDGCVGIDLGPHHFGCLVCSGVQTIQSCYMEGATSSGTYLIFYSNSGNVSDGVSENNTCKYRRWIYNTGTEFAAAGGQTMGYSHVDNGGTVTGLVYNNCRGIFVTGWHTSAEPSWIATANITNPSSSDRLTYAAYPVRVSGGRAVNFQKVSHSSSVAYRQCAIFTPRLIPGDQNYASPSIGITGSSGFTSVYFESCQFIGTLDGEDVSHTHSYFGINNNNSYLDRVILVNCSVLNTGTQADSSGFRAFFDYFTNGTATYTGFECYGCVFEQTSVSDANGLRALCIHDATSGTITHVFVDCVYKNIAAGRYSQDTAFDTQAEWLSSVDTAAIFKTGTLFPYSSAGTLAIDASSQLWMIRRATSTVVPGAGFGGTAYVGFFGAFQGSDTPTSPGGAFAIGTNARRNFHHRKKLAHRER